MGGCIISFNFRDKSAGWGLNYRIKIKTRTKTKTKSCVIDPYYYHFCRETLIENVVIVVNIVRRNALAI